jgi:type IV pilus assembly protein PilV
MRQTQHSKANLRAARACSGVSLVEVLVALVVISVGMLGIAALYVESLRTGRSALTRSQAVILAADMAERIRANPSGGAAYAKTVDAAGTVNAACEQGGSGCTPDAIAAHDIAVWHRMVDSRAGEPTSLPGGRGSIVVATPSALRRYTITVAWDESGQTTANSYVLKIEL